MFGAWFWVPVWYACNRLPLAHLACSGVTSPPLYHTGPNHAWGPPHWLICCFLGSSGFGPCLKFLGNSPLDYAAWYLALGRGNGLTKQVLSQCPSPPGVHVRDCATHAWCARTPGQSFASRPHHSPQRVDRAHDKSPALRGCLSRDTSRKQGVPYLGGIHQVWIH